MFTPQSDDGLKHRYKYEQPQQVQEFIDKRLEEMNKKLELR
ncbi:MAG: hypothetical protein AABY22_00210 [Nanoarchaeota archaeon]